MISAKAISINLLLSVHASETLSKLDKQMSGQHIQVSQKLQEQTALMRDIFKGVQDTKNEVVMSHEATRRDALLSSTRQEQKLESVDNKLSGVLQNLSELTLNLHSTQTSLASLRTLGLQVLAFLRAFPSELQSLLKMIIRTNMQMYVLLLGISERIGASPTLLLQSNIKFEDALGVRRELPFEWFRSWEVRETIKAVGETFVLTSTGI